MPGYRRHKPIHTEDRERELLRRRMRWLVVLAVASMLIPGILLWRSEGFWAALFWLIGNVMFWTIPIAGLQLHLRQLGKDS